MATRSVTHRLQAMLKRIGHDKTLAVAYMGLGYGSEDTASMTGVSVDILRALRTSQHGNLRAIRENPAEARAVLLQMQQDAAILKGFALSHSHDISPSQLRSVAGTASMIAKDLNDSSPIKTAPHQAPPAAPPAPPERPA